MPKTSLHNKIIGRLAVLHARSVTRRFFKAVQRANSVQDLFLKEIIARNADSDFGREHHFAKIHSYEDYKSHVPIRSYAGFQPYIERVLRGETQALFRPREKILMFALTSGTTAKPKYIPITPQVLADSRRGWNTWGIKAVTDHPGSYLRSIVQVTSSMNDHAAASGVPCGAITGLLAATQKKVVLRYYTSPLVVSQIHDALAKYYTIMRLAIPRDVAWVVTANPATLLVLARTANEHRESLIRDIHDGTLCEEMAVSGEIRAALLPRLRPDPSCARRLEKIVSSHGCMYPKHYWNLKFRAHWCGGTMGLYQSQFPRYYGTVPNRDIGLIASEGRMSIPMEDYSPAGILAVTSQFFEFIPAEEYGSLRANHSGATAAGDHCAGSQTLRSDELTEGRDYFLILSNRSGLYRYDIGDRVRVTGWVGRTPLIEFLSRDDHTASMSGEKLTEDQVVMALRRVCEQQGETIVDMIVSPRWGEIPHYRIYVEAADARRIDGLARHYDRTLQEINVEYGQKRESLRLGAIELFELPDGFLSRRDLELRQQRTATSEQFKHQYLLPRPGLDIDLERAPTHIA